MGCLVRWDKDRWVMAWEDDLIADIHFGDERDGIDLPLLPDLDFGMAKIAMHMGFHVPIFGGVASVELSDSNRANLLSSFLSIRDTCKLIVEIGVDRIDKGQSTTRLFLDNKKPETVYFGIDLEDKSYLNDEAKNIYTIKRDSSDSLHILSKLSQILWTEIPEIEIDYLFIDGYHSINQMIMDWEYSQLVRGGIIGIHDTNSHPGPSRFIESLDRSRFIINQCDVVPDDNGITFVRRVGRPV